MDDARQQPAPTQRYRIRRSVVIAQCAEMRVIDQTLAPGEAVPWHRHPDSEDYIICLRGELQVRGPGPDRVTTLRANERCVVPRTQPHSTANATDAECQFLIVQGPGRVEFDAVPEP